MGGSASTHHMGGAKGPKEAAVTPSVCKTNDKSAFIYHQKPVVNVDAKHPRPFTQYMKERVPRGSDDSGAGKSVEEPKSVLESGDDFPKSERKISSEQQKATDKTNSDHCITADSRMVFRNVIIHAKELIQERNSSADFMLDPEEIKLLTQLSQELQGMQDAIKSSKFTPRGTWKLLERINAVESLSHRIYEDMLTRNPSLQALFFGVTMVDQEKILGRMLTTAVEFCGREDKLEKMFLSTGARHRGYGVTSEHFKLIRDSFFRVFPTFVGDGVFKTCKEEWEHFWRIILDALEKGGNTPKGDEYARMRENEITRRLQEDFKIIQEHQNKLGPEKQFVCTMYAKAVELDGDLSEFSRLSNPFFGKVVFRGLLDVVSRLSDMEGAEEYLIDVGARHVSYKVKEEHLKAFEYPFLYACRQYLKGEWNLVVESRFLWLWERLTKWFITGLRHNAKRMVAIRAPDGSRPFCLIQTSFPGSAQFWARDPKGMNTIMKKYLYMIRSIIALYGAYEVKTVEDSVRIACYDIVTGLHLALMVLLEFTRQMPTVVESLPQIFKDHSSAPQLSVTLQHCVGAIATYDAVLQRYDYFGHSVNCCSCISSNARGGQILLSQQSCNVLTAIPEFHSKPCPQELCQLGLGLSLDGKKSIENFINIQEAGTLLLKDTDEVLRLMSITPKLTRQTESVDDSDDDIIICSGPGPIVIPTRRRTL